MLRGSSLVLALATIGGCYLSHEISAARRDAGRSDAGTRDASARDVGTEDAGGRCTGIREAANVTYRVGDISSVTPRLVALPGGDVGLVHVSSDASPTRVRYERFTPHLSGRTTGVTIATDSFTWAEPALRDGEVWVAYGSSGDRGSVIQHVTHDGGLLPERALVPIFHPSILQPSRAGFLWLAFVMEADNALVIGLLDPDGSLRGSPIEIPTGRYGSGHGAVAHPDGRSHVLTYPREGPLGVRQGYVNAIDEDGGLGPERQLSDDGDDLVRPIRRGDELILVRHGDALVLEPTDFDTLERLDRVAFPPRDSRPFFVGQLEGRILVGHIADGELRIDDFGEDLGTPERLVVRPINPPVSVSGSVLEVPGAIYFATHLADGSQTFPFVVRVECTYD